MRKLLKPWRDGRPRRISSAFGAARPGGRKHNGTDYVLTEGTELVAPGDGRVAKRWTDDKGGNQLVIRLLDGRSVGYAHLLMATVVVGQAVVAGEVVALSGGRPGTAGAGTTTGAHLHVTLRSAAGELVDPASEWGEA